MALLGLSLVAFPDLVSRFRQRVNPYAAMPPECDLGSGACTATFPDGQEVVLRVSPQSLRHQDPLTLTVQVEGRAQPQSVELQGADMPMGLVKLPLSADHDLWSATGHLPACSTERMQWRADVILDDRVAGFTFWSVR